MEHQNKLKAEYTHGSIAVTMIKTAFAMLASTLAMSAYNIADTFFVGQLGGEAPLAAMGFTFPIVMFFGCIFGGFGGGCMATMAHAIGEGDQKGACRIVTSGLLLISILSIITAIFGVCFGDYIYGWMGAQGETLVQLKGYMNIWFYGCITAGVSMPGNHLLIAAGKPKIASFMTFAGMAINVVLDPLMIYGGTGCVEMLPDSLPTWFVSAFAFLMKPFAFMPAMGIRGAALATIISQCFSAVALAFILRHVGLLTFKPIPWEGIRNAWHRITAYAVPNILGMLLFPITNYITTWVTAYFGETMVAAIAAAGRLENLAFILPMAFGIPLMSVIAQNYGAGLYSRVRFAFKFASLLALVFLTITGLILFFFSPYLVGIFTPEKSIQALMIQYMHIIPWGFALIEITRFCGFALTGCGHPRMDAILKAVRMLGIMIPLSLLTRYFQWQPGVFYTRLATDVLGGIICLFFAIRMLRALPKEDRPQPQNDAVNENTAEASA